MKRIFFILAALIFSLLVHADDYGTIEHIFQDKANAKDLTINSPTNTVATVVSDGTVYTCSTGATFGFDVQDVLGAGLPYNKELSISPAVNRLSYFRINYYYSNTADLEIYLSTDGSTWSKQTENITSGSGYIAVTSLFGNYYIKVKNKTASTVYIRGFTYNTHPDCGCFPYVAP